MTVDPWFVVLSLGLAEGLFLMVALFLLRNKRQLSINILISLILCLLSLITLQLLGFFLDDAEMTQLYQFGGGIPFLMGPLLFFYLKSVVRPDYAFGVSSYVHLLPFVLYLTLLVFPSMRSMYTVGLFTFAKAMHTFAYLVFAYIFLRKTSSSNDHKKTWYNAKLLSRLVVLQIFALLLIYGMVAIELTIPKLEIDSDRISAAIFVFFFFALVLLIILHPDSTIPNKHMRGSYVTSSLDEKQKKDTHERLIHLLETEKPHLNPELTLGILAEKLEVNTHQLSQVINEMQHKNFNQLINEYRVEEVKKNILDPKRSLLGIAYDSGFKSKSAFNRIFKAIEGQTPSQFKKSLE